MHQDSVSYFKFKTHNYLACLRCFFDVKMSSYERQIGDVMSLFYHISSISNDDKWEMKYRICIAIAVGVCLQK